MTRKLLAPGETIPQFNHPLPPVVWASAIRAVNQALEQRKAKYAADLETTQKEHLQKVLARLREDFGRKKRTFKQALLGNPPNIPLWGVMSNHPTVLHIGVDLRTGWRIVDEAGIPPAAVNMEPLPGGVAISFQNHSDLASVLALAPPGTAQVQPSGKAKLVASTDNKLAGLEQFFGVNGLGPHAQCPNHSPGEKRDLFCLSSGTGSTRELRWFCNQCRQFCTPSAPKPEPASSFLPPYCFKNFNRVPPTYKSDLRDAVSMVDLKHRESLFIYTRTKVGE
jgi:hypothetical protein